MKMHIDNGAKTFDTKVIFENIKIEIPNKSFTCFIGKSGIGKTTLLRLLAGLEKLDSGTIYLNRIAIDKPGTKRIVVFQSFEQLFPWLTVAENVMFPFKAKKNKCNNTEKAMEIVDRVGLKEYYNCYPNTLSGGMKQRVAIARALFAEPEVLLLDEPFSSLDPITRKKLQNLILDLWKERGLTIIMVTHNVNEAVLLSDRIYCLREGLIESVEIEIERPRCINTALYLAEELTNQYF